VLITAARPRPRRSWPAHCRITGAPPSSAHARSARAPSRHHPARVRQRRAAADHGALLHAVRPLDPGQGHHARHPDRAGRSRRAQGAHRHQGEASLKGHLKAEGDEGDRLAVLHSARSEGRQGAPQRARPDPRHHQELGLSAEPEDGRAELTGLAIIENARGGRRAAPITLGVAWRPAGLLRRLSQLGPILDP